MCCNEWDLLRAFARNNLWITAKPASEGGAQIWGFETYTRDWRTDLDYDAFDWGSSVEPFTYAGMVFPDVGSFADASGLEMNGMGISKSDCFTDVLMSAPSPAPVPPHVLTLKLGCEAIDSGAVLPGINDDFAGTGPDRGAHEYGRPAATYGPRAPIAAPPLAPSDLIGSVSTGGISLEWRDNSIDEERFDIERSPAGQPFTIVGSTPANTSRYVDTHAVPGTPYTYRVSAFGQVGRSPYSNIVSVTVPPTAEPVDEVVLYANAALVHPGWTLTPDTTAAGGARLQNADAGAGKLTTASMTPVDYFDLTFMADAEYLPPVDRGKGDA